MRKYYYVGDWYFTTPVDNATIVTYLISRSRFETDLDELHDKLSRLSNFVKEYGLIEKVDTGFHSHGYTNTGEFICRYWFRDPDLAMLSKLVI